MRGLDLIVTFAAGVVIGMALAMVVRDRRTGTAQQEGEPS